MKKIILSTLVIIIFLGYALQQKMSGSNSTNLVSPLNPNSNLNQSQTNSQIDNPTEKTQTTTALIYKDGAYIGDSVDAYYGNVQVKTTISGGKITDVQFLDYPQDRNRSIEINTQAIPILKSEAIQVQNAQVDIVSGATQTSLGFQKSLQSALVKAQG
jgi:uncharacterized protein with FMN-binding domain